MIEGYGHKFNNMYLDKKLYSKTKFLVCALFLDIIFCFTPLLVFPFTIIDYCAAAIGYFACFTIAFGFLLFLRLRSIILISAAHGFSIQFLEATEPFLNVNELKVPTFNSGAQIKWYSKYRSKNLSLLDGAIRKGYLKNCAIEIHAGVPKVVLAKKVVKDKCPTCGALITEVESDTCICKYCGSTIKRVVVKN